ncbi:MAG: flagellar basal body rod protein FlgB [Steroidobacteraceae bacterium]
MPFNLNAYLGIQPDALQVFSQRATVLAANLANADTPGYKARDIDFRAALAAADPQSGSTGGGASGTPGGSGVQMLTTNPLDVTASAAAPGALSTSQFLRYRIPLAPSLDGNTVSSQMEEAKFAQNTVRYQAALSFLEQRFRDLSTAITGQ